MFVAMQPCQKDDDYRKLIEGLEPPPPPSGENTWELHFCKWWGWNWVKRKDAGEAPLQKSNAPRPIEDAKKPDKKPAKNLRRGLCFKKKKENEPLQKMYNTPSNSVIEDAPNKKIQKPPANLQNVYDTPTNSGTQIGNKKVQIHQQDQAQTVNESRKDYYTTQNVQPQSHKQKHIRKEYITSSSDECYCSSNIDRNRSSTEESVEYINITCCPCCHPREPPVKKCTIEKCTQDYSTPQQGKMTQTEVKEKKHKRKRICLVCCCKCEQNYQPRCCACDKFGKVEERSPKHVLVERICQRTDDFPFDKENRQYKTYTATVNQSSPFEKECKTPKNFPRKFEPFYVAGMPIDMMLYCNKPITKLGLPSQSYPWIQTTRSDIWDQFSHLKSSQEFSSPLSGKTYNISPIKIEDIGSEPSVLLNPLSVEEELKSLKKIESDIKMDLKSRLMLDAVCDAILAKDKLDETSSVFLNEFSYPSNVTENDVRSNASKSQPRFTCSKLNQTGLNEAIFDDIVNKSSENKVNSETNTSKVSIDLDVCCRESESLRDYTKMRSPQMYSMENSYRAVLRNTFIPLHYKSQLQNIMPKKNNETFKLRDYAITNNQPLASVEQSLLGRTKLIPKVKRSASPNTRVQDIKKVKLRESATLTSYNNTNVSDIFKKIDEIVMRSKVNNKEIQNVLNTIPKRTFQFFTSWEVSDLAKQNPPLQIMEQGTSSTSGMSTIDELKEKHENKVKVPQTKKKKTYSKPSLIPKRITDPKVNKKNLI